MDWIMAQDDLTVPQKFYLNSQYNCYHYNDDTNWDNVTLPSGLFDGNNYNPFSLRYEIGG